LESLKYEVSRVYAVHYINGHYTHIR